MISGYVDSDFSLAWTISRSGIDREFICIASRFLGHIDDIRHITYIAVNFAPSNAHTALKENTVWVIDRINWKAFFSTARQFPHLCRIAIQYTYDEVPEFDPREFLSHVVAHLGEVPRDLDDIFEVYIGYRKTPHDWPKEYEWTKLDWHSLLEESRRKVRSLSCFLLSTS